MLDLKSSDCKTFEFAAPSKGYALSTAAERYASPLRAAANKIALFLGERDVDHSAFSWVADHGASARDSERLAWNLVCVWIIHKIANSGGGLADAIMWFFRGESPGPASLWRDIENVAADALVSSASSDALEVLLPYLIDRHGPGSRIAVLREPRRKQARSARKSVGAFYTPSDVAEYMLRETLAPIVDTPPPTVLDLAAGTGVFLRAALHRLVQLYEPTSRYELAARSLFGTDIDALALDGAAYVLTSDCLAEGNERPATIWARLRRNFACVDALGIDLEESRLGLGRHRLGSLFPSMAEGADVIVGNPPYASLGARATISSDVAHLETIRANPRPAAEIFPAFLEQMMRLSKPKTAAAMVVPLSFAYHSGRQFAACRRLIERKGGRWRFAFFDREPHALFGEDAKTRNAIIFWNGNGRHSEFHTGPLQRWRSEDRKHLFQSVRFTPFAAPIAKGIPKLAGALQASIWSALSEERVTLEDMVGFCGKCDLGNQPYLPPTEVLVGPTAYNFLNVARPFSPTTKIENASRNPLHRLTPRRPGDADKIFAILCSNYAFWWWHVHGDGFHVNISNISSIPIGSAVADGKLDEALNALGARSWAEASKKPLYSNNRGRVSIAFPEVAASLRYQIDLALMHSLRAPASFADELAEFVGRTKKAQSLHPATTRWSQ